MINVEYKKQFDLIKKLIKLTYKNFQIEFEYLEENNALGVCLDKIVKILIYPNNSWIDIKINIDTQLKQTMGNHICDECNDKIKCLASCNNCRSVICVECYINNFRTNKGIIKCKICSYSFGNVVPEEYIDFAIDNIRSNAKINKNK